MQEAIANLVHPVFAYGLRLKERLARGETPTFELEQAALKGLLLSEIEARRRADFGGEGEEGAEGRSRSGPTYLGTRYALTCWLDELFILDSPWSSRWNERKLEVALYGTNDRAWKFWEQARLAEARAGVDAVEVYFLCVMLGFRGELREEPERVQAWATATQSHLARRQIQEWPYPPELEPPSNVPPLRGATRFRRMMAIGAAALVVMVPLVTLAVRKLM